MINILYPPGSRASLSDAECGQLHPPTCIDSYTLKYWVGSGSSYSDCTSSTKTCTYGCSNGACVNTCSESNIAACPQVGPICVDSDGYAYGSDEGYSYLCDDAYYILYTGIYYCELGEYHQCEDACDPETNQCTVNEYCGDGITSEGIGEECDSISLPQSNDPDCPQSTSTCSGAKTGTRDSSGDCDTSCYCDLDSYSYSCVQNSCGAKCDANTDCGSGGACSTSTCLCTSCNDNSLCTTDALSSGSCTFTQISCNDNKECTTDSCGASTGCVYINKASGTACTGGTCDSSGNCVPTQSCTTAFPYDTTAPLCQLLQPEWIAFRTAWIAGTETFDKVILYGNIYFNSDSGRYSN